MSVVLLVAAGAGTILLLLPPLLLLLLFVLLALFNVSLEAADIFDDPYIEVSGDDEDIIPAIEETDVLLRFCIG